jgi:hypothetical protein
MLNTGAFSQFPLYTDSTAARCMLNTGAFPISFCILTVVMEMKSVVTELK